MPVKIQKNITYSLDVKLPSLEIEKQVTVDEKGLCACYNELEELCKEIADTMGAVRLPTYKTPTTPTVPSLAKNRPSSEVMEKLKAYARAHTDFTIKGASEDLHIPENTLYQGAVKLMDECFLTRTQVLGGIAHIYALHPVQRTKDKHAQEKEKEKIVVLPEGKVPFVPNLEREKLQNLRG